MGFGPVLDTTRCCVRIWETGGCKGAIETWCNQHGGDPNGRCYNARTALHVASFHGQTIVIELLLEHGADIGAKDHFGYTILYEAARLKPQRCCSNAALTRQQRRTMAGLRRNWQRPVDQGAPGTEKKDPGLFFFELTFGQGLSKYVSGRLSRYGNCISNLYAT